MSIKRPNTIRFRNTELFKELVRMDHSPSNSSYSGKGELVGICRYCHAARGYAEGSIVCLRWGYRKNYHGCPMETNGIEAEIAYQLAVDVGLTKTPLDSLVVGLSYPVSAA